MTWSDRYKLAYSSYITKIGVIVALSICIFLMILPFIIWPNIFTITTSSNTISFAIYSGTWLIILASTLIFIIISIVIAGLIGKITSGYYSNGTDFWFKILLYIPIMIWTIYKMFFGDYFKKWYFLKVLFQPKEVAKDLLLED